MDFGWLPLICFGALGLVWLAGALYNYFRGPAAGRLQLPFCWLAIVPVAIVVGLLISAPWLPWAGAVVLVVSTIAGVLGVPWLLWAGAVVLVASTAYAVWARFVLGTMWANRPMVKVGHRLVTSGPYAITRHPIYTGLLGMLLGTLLVHFKLFTVVLFTLLAFVFALRIPREERLMEQTFGEAYREYRRRVPQLIPGVRFPSAARTGNGKQLRRRSCRDDSNPRSATQLLRTG